LPWLQILDFRVGENKGGWMLVFSGSCFGPRQGARQTLKPPWVSKFALSAPFRGFWLRRYSTLLPSSLHHSKIQLIQNNTGMVRSWQE
jgi:hypothetical protein